MHHKEQQPILSETESRLARFVPSGGIDDAHKGIEENFAGMLETDAMLCVISQSLLCIPRKALPSVREVNIHAENMYMKRIYACQAPM
jgi:hypothetical protein